MPWLQCTMLELWRTATSLTPLETEETPSSSRLALVSFPPAVHLSVETAATL